MGEISDGMFRSFAERQERNSVKRKGRILESKRALETAQREAAQQGAAGDARRVLGTDDQEDLKNRLSSHLDTKKVEGRLIGEDKSGDMDRAIRQLEDEKAFYRRGWDRIKGEGIAARARSLGLVRQPVGYEAPATAGRKPSRGPLLLTVAVGIAEDLQTASFLNSRVSVLQSQIGGNVRVALVFLLATLWVAIVMTLTYLAGRQLKEATLASRGSKAEVRSNAHGGVMGPALLLLGLAGVFQMVTLGARISTTTGDQSAQGAAVVFGLISLCGALGVLIWEYSAHVPPSEATQLVHTRAADEKKVDDLRHVEERLGAGIDRDLRNLEIDALREEEREIERLQHGALDASSMHMSTLNARLDVIRHDIAALYDKQFDYAPLDLDEAVATYASRYASASGA